LFMSVGRFDKQKDLVTLIYAFSDYYEKTKRGYLYLIGEGEEKLLLRKLIKDLKLAKRIRFLGWQRNIYKFIKRANIYISSSVYEGFGRTIMEAMVLRVPVITTDAPYGPAELVGRNYGALVKCADYRKIAKLMYQIETNPVFRKKLVSQLFKRIQSYSETKMLMRYKLLFKSLFRM